MEIKPCLPINEFSVSKDLLSLESGYLNIIGTALGAGI